MDWIILTIISALFLGLRDVYAKKFFDKMDPYVVAWHFTLFTALATLIFYDKIQFFTDIRLFLLVIKGLVLVGIFYFMYTALKIGEISLILPFANLVPVFIVFSSFFFLGESLTIVQYLGIFVIVAGAVLLSFNKKKKGVAINKLLDKRLVLYVAFFIVLVIIGYTMDKYILQNYDVHPYTLLFYCFFIVALAFTPITIRRWKGEYALKMIPIGIFSFISEALYVMIAASALTKISLIVPVRNLNILFATIVGGIMFKEKNLRKRIIVCTVMIIGVFLIYLGN
ncbi:EamA family transporter [Candidatus Woesearchaeota archaeon]|nr:EamA family transporter [Candidatus Woesearchaeota archaeon]